LADGGDLGPERRDVGRRGHAPAGRRPPRSGRRRGARRRGRVGVRPGGKLAEGYACRPARAGRVGRGRRGRGVSRHPPAVPADRNGLAVVLHAVGFGRVPGRRHGAGQDHPGAGAAVAAAPGRVRQGLAVDRSGLAAGELASGGQKVRPVPEAAGGPSLPDAPRGVGGAGGEPGDEAGRRGRCDDDLQHGRPAGVAGRGGLGPAHPRRGPGDQEPIGQADAGGQANQGPRPNRDDRHADREPPRRPVVPVRFPQSRPARQRQALPAVRPRPGAPGTPKLRPPPEAGLPIYPAPPQDRSEHHLRPAREDGDASSAAGWCWPT